MKANITLITFLLTTAGLIGCFAWFSSSDQLDVSSLPTSTMPAAMGKIVTEPRTISAEEVRELGLVRDLEPSQVGAGIPQFTKTSTAAFSEVPQSTFHRQTSLRVISPQRKAQAAPSRQSVPQAEYRILSAPGSQSAAAVPQKLSHTFSNIAGSPESLKQPEAKGEQSASKTEQMFSVSNKEVAANSKSASGKEFNASHEHQDFPSEAAETKSFSADAFNSEFKTTSYGASLWGPRSRKAILSEAQERRLALVGMDAFFSKDH